MTREETNGADLALCFSRIRELENSLTDLRLSRRLLVCLLEQEQEQARRERELLLRENRRLRRSLTETTRQLWQCRKSAGGGLP